MPFCRPAQSQGWPIVVWRHTGVRFLLSGAAAVLPSAARRRQPPCHSVGPRSPKAGPLWCGDTQGFDSSSPALRLCCPAWCGIGSRHAILSACAITGLTYRGVETRRCSTLLLQAAAALREPACVDGSKSHALASRWPTADVQSVLMACTAARSQPKLGCPGGLARLRGRCLFGSCPLSSVPRRSKLKNAGVSRAGART